MFISFVSIIAVPGGGPRMPGGGGRGGPRMGFQPRGSYSGGGGGGFRPRFSGAEALAYDGKRMRNKTVLRKTVDYNPSILTYVEVSA